MQVQFTASRTVVAKSGLLLPATIDQSTDFNLITTATAIFYKMSGCLGSFDMYIGLDGGQDARVLWPSSISFTKDKKIVARCYCTMRQQWKSFRVDRMLTCHALTTPDDMEADEPQEPHQDWEDSPQGRAIAAR